MTLAAEKQILSSAELEARALELARPPERVEDDHTDHVGLLTVEIHGECYGIPVPHVREVICRPVITPIPAAPAFVAGLMNLRGDIVGILDLAVMFGLSKPAGHSGEISGFAVLVRSSESDSLVAGLLADSVMDVAWRPPGVFERVPPSIPSSRAVYFRETFRLGQRLVTSLYIDKILGHSELGSPQEARS